jgi:hypothetical protein
MTKATRKPLSLQPSPKNLASATKRKIHRGILNLQKDFRLMFLSASSAVSSEQRERARDKGCFEF